MKKFTFLPALIAGALTLTACGTTGSGSLASGVGQTLISNALTGGNSTNTTTETTTSTGTSVLGNLLSSLLGESSTLSTSDLVGTWNYTGSDCVFESENLLAKAGGAVAAKKIESNINSQLAKVGIQEGACTFTFNKDNTYSAQIGGRTISGTYTLDASQKTVKMTYLAGLASMTPHVVKKGSKLSLLIESDKLLTLVKGVSALSNSTSLKTVSTLLGNYDGLYIGMQLSK